MTATILQLNSSAGGVPKLPLAEATISATGIDGDTQAKPGIHGGPYRALCLLGIESIDALAAEGHPIAPGTTGENVTTAGLDWSLVVPNTRLRLGAGVVIEITGFADPCATIRGSFSDGNINRLNHRLECPSRVYARVLSPGVVRPGDPITIEAAADPGAVPVLAASGIRRLDQVSVAVSDMARSIEFYQQKLGAVFQRHIEDWGLAFFDLGGITLMLESPAHHGGEVVPGTSALTFEVEEIDAAFQAMSARGVSFDVPPLMQWEEGGVQGWMAFLRDPDGNRLGLVSRVVT